MIYGYIRVSTDKQTTENQAFEINCFSKKNKIRVDKWIKETISGTSALNKRKLGHLLKNMQPEDILLTTELSRLGRNLLQVMSILNYCLNNDIQVWTIKDGYKLGSDIQSKVSAKQLCTDLFNGNCNEKGNNAVDTSVKSEYDNRDSKQQKIIKNSIR